MSQGPQPNIDIGGKGFCGLVFVLQFIYRLRSAYPGRLWTPKANWGLRHERAEQRALHDAANDETNT